MRNQYKSAMKRRIDAGVEWLNSRTEKFWDDYVDWSGVRFEDILDGNWLNLDLGYLDLQDGTFCVLGQAGGSYSEVTRFAHMTFRRASELGFLLDEEEYGRKGEFTAEHYSLFTELWIEKIKALRLERERKQS